MGAGHIRNLEILGMTDTIYAILIALWFIDVAALFVWRLWPVDTDVYLSKTWEAE